MHTVSGNSLLTVLHAAEKRRPSHEVVEVEAQVVVLGEGVEVREVQVEKVRRGHATDGGHIGRV